MLGLKISMLGCAVYAVQFAGENKYAPYFAFIGLALAIGGCFVG